MGRQGGREEEAALWQARMVEIDTGLTPGRIDVATHRMCALMITSSRLQNTESGQAGQATWAIHLTLMLKSRPSCPGR